MLYSKADLLIMEFNAIEQSAYDYDFTELNTAMVSCDLEALTKELKFFKETI